ncbi:orotidine-5'-phosphate decarboxylase [Slackia heliotrinireducens]|jgi:orotidine-5'-phosphate decarboxylase|uniref:orotidine-5'-phosphate decarboxylase n=1 Tax=Slackia heliotrinireducens TaxID=84110 RepID=UPI00331535BE
MLTVFDSVPRSDRIIVALDCDRAEALSLAKQLQGKAKWMKVGMTLYYAEGPNIVEILGLLGYKVFLDLKFHDIPHQVAGAAESAVLAGADMITMHAIGGMQMMEAAQRAVDESGSDAATLAITVLTSMDEEQLHQTGVNRTIPEQVQALATRASDAGLSGVVASPQEAGMLRRLLGPDAYIVTPGVRPAGADRGDQSRVATPKEAFDAGASHIVIGRPITQAEDPVAAFDAIAAQL